MAQRCGVHNCPEPCIYCDHDFPAFSGWRDRVEALEQLYINLTKRGGAYSLAVPLVSPNPDLPLREFKPSQAIAVVRDVGIGDIVMMSPSLKALKLKNPDRPLVFVTKPENFDVLAGASYLDAMLPINAFDPRGSIRSTTCVRLSRPSITVENLPLTSTLLRPVQSLRRDSGRYRCPQAIRPCPS
ncbi:hypothetical protein DFAR_3900008 [Desulfarculales bacterium]